MANLENTVKEVAWQLSSIGRTVAPELSTTLGELGLEDIDRSEMMMSLEDVYHVDLNEDLFNDDSTLEEIVNYVHNQIAELKAAITLNKMKCR
jgi:acyl carrier protein